MKIKLSKTRWEEIGKKCGWMKESEIDYNKYLSFTPKLGGEYYILSIPDNINPPEKGQHLVIDGCDVVVFSISTPEKIAAGRGGPVAKSMKENGIGWKVNCLPEGHEYFKN